MPNPHLQWTLVERRPLCPQTWFDPASAAASWPPFLSWTSAEAAAVGAFSAVWGLCAPQTRWHHLCPGRVLEEETGRHWWWRQSPVKNGKLPHCGLPGADFLSPPVRCSIRSVKFWTVVLVQDSGLQWCPPRTRHRRKLDLTDQTGEPGLLHWGLTLRAFRLGQVYRRRGLRGEDQRWDSASEGCLNDNVFKAKILHLTCLGILLMAKRYSLSRMQFPRALPKHLNKTKHIQISQIAPTSQKYEWFSLYVLAWEELEKLKFQYFSALFMPSVTASFLAFSRERALDFSPSLTPYPTSSWNAPSWRKSTPHTHEFNRTGAVEGDEHCRDECIIFETAACEKYCWHCNEHGNDVAIRLTFSWTLINALTPT